VNIECCVCGEDLPDKLSEAIENALYSLKENAPVIGIVCDPCLENLKKEGIID
jgi:hypothetical protein